MFFVKRDDINFAKVGSRYKIDFNKQEVGQFLLEPRPSCY